MVREFEQVSGTSLEDLGEFESCGRGNPNSGVW